LTKIEKVIERLTISLGNNARVVSGWVNEIKDFTIPAISVTTHSHWRGHADINIWSHTEEETVVIAQKVITVLNTLKASGLGIAVYSAMPIRFEEKGVLQPGSWKQDKKSKPIFRMLVEIGY
jgi:hypothetical protein